MAPADASALAHIEDHGARLRELESNYSDVASQLAANAVQLSSLTSTVENGMEALGSKFDAFASFTQAEMKRQGTIVDTLDRIEKERVEHETKRVARRDRLRGALRAWIVPILAAVVGMAGKELGGFIWRHL